MTIRERIEKLYKNRRGADMYISVHANWTSEGEVIGFYLNDWESPFEDFKLNKELDYELANENRSNKIISLGFSRQGVR